MIRAFALSASLLLAAPVGAQTDVVETRDGAPRSQATHLFEIRDGGLWLDGRALPASAVPAGLDLSGIVTQMEYTPPLAPVVEVDGEPYVFEDERLIAFAASSRPNRAVYILGETVVAPQQVSADRLEPVVQEAYRQRLSEADQALYAKMERERVLESEALVLASRTRRTPAGPSRDALVAELRDRLDAIFRLKQEIRREEVARVDAEVRALRAVLDEREAMHGEIIEHRLRELIGE